MFRMTQILGRAMVCAATLGAALAAAPAQAQDTSGWQAVRKAGVLRCGVALSAPYTLKDPLSGAYGGVFPGLCKDFGEQVLKVKVQFVDTTWDNIVAGLQSDKWDISVSLNDTPEREKAISFSQSVVDYSVTFAYNRNNPKLAKPVKSLAEIDKPGVQVAVMSGSAADRVVTGTIRQATIMRLPGFDETRLALMSKRADVLADDNMSNLMLARSHGDWAEIYKSNPPLAQQGIAFGVRKDTPAADVAVLNQFIAQQIKSGSVNGRVDAAIKQTLAATK